MMRDGLKTEAYWEELLAEAQRVKRKNDAALLERSFSEGQEEQVKYFGMQLSKSMICAMYSSGQEIPAIRQFFLCNFQDMAGCSLLGYPEYLLLASLIILLDAGKEKMACLLEKILASKERFHKVNLRDDWLLGFLADSYMEASAESGDSPKDAPPPLFIPKWYLPVYDIWLSPAGEREARLAAYVRQWYTKRRGEYWWGTHTAEDRRHLYVGYWCFEAAALAGVMQIDDSLASRSRYYPTGLAHWAAGPEKGKFPR